jgi:cysteine desulfurase
MQPIYLDYNATTPIAPEVVEAMLPYLYQHFGNPSSGHIYGLRARQAVQTARRQVAALLSCEPREVIFTSGGTESNNHAIRGAALAARAAGRGDEIITSAVEHPAVLQVCRWLQRQGFELTLLPVDRLGRVDPTELEQRISARTALVTVMLANNEVGTIQPVAELAEITHRYGALFHSDAAQAAGKIKVDINALGVDLLSLAGHKLYGPKGVGALYVRAGTPLEKLLLGADHEADRRPGTENVLGIVGLGRACELARQQGEAFAAPQQVRRDQLHQGLLAALGAEAVRLNGHPEKRLPNTLSLAFRGIAADALLAAIADQVAASAGAACHAGGVKLSTVLEAMRIPTEWAMGTLRFSVGRVTSAEQIEHVVVVVAAAVRSLRAVGDETGAAGTA